MECRRAPRWCCLRGGERSEPKRRQHQRGAEKIRHSLFSMRQRLLRSLESSSVADWTHSARIHFSQLSNQQIAKVHGPDLWTYWLEPNRVSNKGFADKALAPMPFDLSVASHAPHR